MTTSTATHKSAFIAYLHPDQKQRLREYAKKMRCPMSMAVRQILEEALTKELGPAPKNH